MGNSKISIQFLGAAGTVTGSKHLLKTPEKESQRIKLDVEKYSNNTEELTNFIDKKLEERIFSSRDEKNEFDLKTKIVMPIDIFLVIQEKLNSTNSILDDNSFHLLFEEIQIGIIHLIREIIDKKISVTDNFSKPLQGDQSWYAPKQIIPKQEWDEMTKLNLRSDQLEDVGFVYEKGIFSFLGMNLDSCRDFTRDEIIKMDDFIFDAVIESYKYRIN